MNSSPTLKVLTLEVPSIPMIVTVGFVLGSVGTGGSVGLGASVGGSGAEGSVKEPGIE